MAKIGRRGIPLPIGAAAIALSVGGAVLAVAQADSYGFSLGEVTEVASAAVGQPFGGTESATPADWADDAPADGVPASADAAGSGDAAGSDDGRGVPTTADSSAEAVTNAQPEALAGQPPTSENRASENRASEQDAIAEREDAAGTAVIPTPPTTPAPTAPPTSFSSVSLAAPATAYPPTTAFVPPATEPPAVDASPLPNDEVQLGPGPGLQPAPTAPAPIVTAPPSATGDEVLAELGIDFASLLPGWTIEFLGPRTGMRGTTFPYEHRIEIYVRDSFTHEELVHVVGHEVGHAVDVTYLNDADRAQWAAARGYSGRSWWTGNGLTDFAVGAGDWAECYAWAHMGHGPWYSELGDPPSAELNGLMTELIG